MKWLKRITVAYLIIGVLTAFVFLASADFDVDWTFDNLKMFLYIVLAWPLWVWFMIVIWLTYRKQ